METQKLLEEFYSSYDEEGRLASRAGSVEFLTTMRYIQKYLQSGMRVLEIGAGTGRYSHALAREGYQVDAVELVQHNLDILKQNTQVGENLSVRQGNAKNLDFLADDTYDLTLLLGPMYHLFTVEEQKQALREAIRVTKRGGLIFAAYCGNDPTVIQYFFGQGMLREKHYQELLDPVTFKAGSDPLEMFELYRREDIDALMESFSVTRLHYVGTDMATHYMRQSVNDMDDALFEMYLNYCFAVCERPDMVGISHHILDIFQKD